MSNHKRRSWLFLSGGDEGTLFGGPASEADVLVQELEDFALPALRPQARAISADVIAAWRDAGATTAARVNQLANPAAKAERKSTALWSKFRSI